MHIGFEYIHPEPTLPPGIAPADLLTVDWSSQTKAALAFKTSLSRALRVAQVGRCCYCRRVLYDNYATHIEHFIDKSSFPEYRFEIRNLALSCGTCNIKKAGYFKRWNRRSRIPSLGINSHHCPVINTQLPPGTPYPTEAKDFRWVNPYVHNYSNHIDLGRGWIFRSKTREGGRTIKWLKLNEVGEIERRALFERMQTRGGLLSKLVYAISELNQHRARDVGDVLARAIATRGRIRRKLPQA
ncbi:hypothetical protein HDC96_002640 [Stenotrophomonas sp. JAI102]|nr:hypothetical protein [Stenotrophomonas sp. JAI102]